MFVELQGGGQHSDLWLQTDSLLLQPVNGGQGGVDFRSTRDADWRQLRGTFSERVKKAVPLQAGQKMEVAASKASRQD